MVNQKTDNQPVFRRLPITPQRIALIRLWNDLLIVVVSFIFLSPILATSPARIVMGCVAGMFVGSLLGYFLIQQGRTLIGMGFVIYGLLFGLTAISVFIEGLGPFTIVSMVLVTALSVSYAIPVRRVIEAIFASLVLGAFSLIFDMNFQGAAFRIAAPPQLTTTLWLITFVLVGIIFYFIIQQFPYFSLQAKMITSFAAITLLALSVLGFLNTRSVQSVLTEEANQSLFNAAKQTEESLRQFITTNLQTIKTEARLPIFVEYLSSSENGRLDFAAQVQATLTALAAKDPNYISSYALLDLQGNVVADTQIQHISANEADLNSFSEAVRQGNPVMSSVEIDPFNSEPSIYFFTSVSDGDNRIGILRVRYRAEMIQNIIAKSNNRGGENSFAVLFDENLIHLAHGISPETIFTSVTPLDIAVFEALIEDRRLPMQTPDETFLDLPDLEANLKKALSSAEGLVYFEATDIATDELVNQVVVVDMGEPAWLLAFFQPQEIYLAPIKSLANITILLGLLSGFGAVVLGVGMTQILTRPILNLTETAQRVAQGDFNAKVEIGTEDEIGTLGKTFNTITMQLQNLITNLESQVEMRTKSLRNQAAQLRASAEVARDVTSEQNLQDLLDRATNLIYDRFGYYHVGIYLKDSKNEYANLASSTDQPGKRLLQAAHRYTIDTESNVGYACIVGEAILASASDQITQYQFNPILPNSLAQLVLPLNLGNQTLGAIDIHSTNPTSFTQEDVQIFQTMADQIAIAVQKARYQEEIQETLHELEAAYGTFTKESWQKFVQARKNISGYRYNQSRVEIVETPTNEVVKAWKEGQSVSSQKKSTSNPATETSILAIPMKVRGEVIGVLNIEFDSNHVPADTTVLVSEIADRLGLILENARLIETAQRQVERERLTSHITNAIRQSLDMDMVLRTAVQEIGESLGLSEVELRLGTINQVLNKNQAKTNGRPDSDQARK